MGCLKLAYRTDYTALNVVYRKYARSGNSCAGGYRYGFNGKENDDEVKGNGNQQDYGERIYDTRLGRFLSVDPLAASYPFYSPYQFAGNTPIQAIDLDGLEPMVPMANGAYTPPSDQIQKPLNDPAALKYLESKTGGYKESALVNALVDITLALTPLDEISALVTGEDANGNEVSSFAAAINLGLATTRGKTPVSSTKLKTISGAEIPNKFTRAMSNAELKEMKSTGILRGKRGLADDAENFFTDKSHTQNSKTYAKEYGLDNVPQVKVEFSITDPNVKIFGPDKAKPGQLGKGGGIEFKTVGKTPVNIEKVTPFKK